MTKRINSIEKITSDLVTNIQDVALKSVQGEIENTIKYFIGTVVNIDVLNNRAKVRYMRTTEEGQTGYTDIEATVKTDEIIEIGDIVIVFYIRNLANSFIFGKMTSSYYSKIDNTASAIAQSEVSNYVTLGTDQTIKGQKTFKSENTYFNHSIKFDDIINPNIQMTSNDGNDDITYLLQSQLGLFGLGVNWNVATKWNENGVADFPANPTVNNKNIAVFDEVGSGGHAGDSGYGGYVRFTNGIQICWDYYPIGTFSSGTRTMSFSKSFATSTTPIVLINPVTNRGSASYDRETCPNTISNTGATITWNTGISYTGYCMVALGTWQ